MLIYQVPGGMLSNMESQLKEQGAYDRYEEVLKEVPRVREDLGFIPLVTPTSQIVGTQAVMNVLAGERYKILTRETEDIIRGMYGATPAPVNPDLIKQVLGDEAVITCRPADLIEPELETHRRDIGDLAECDEDVVSYTLFPKVAKPYFEVRHDADALQAAIAAQQPKKTAPPAASDAEPGAYTVSVNGQAYNVTVVEGHDGNIAVQDVQPVAAAPAPAAPAPAPAAPAAASGEGKPVECPMGGNIWKLNVKLGDQVQVGDVVIVLEAMKMEVEVTSTLSGTVTALNCKEGDAVAPGQALLMIG